jgi:hypothetical protein
MLSQNVRTKATLATALIGQFDKLGQEEIGTRYNFEMARARPGNGTKQEVTANTAQYEGAYRQKQWEIAQMERLIERLTGITISPLRALADDLVTLIGRREEIAQELRNRVLLTPALIVSLQGATDADSVEALGKSTKAVTEVPTLQAHLDAIDAQAEIVADRIAYHPVSDLVVPGPLHLATR